MNQSYTHRVSTKKVFCAFFIFLSCFIISSSVLAQGSLDEGLVAHWTMNQTEYSGSTLLDKTTNANNLTNYSATFTTDRTGTSNGAMNFGTRINTYYLSIANNSSLQIVGNQTISMWLKPADLSAGRQNPYAKAYGGEGTITQETTGRLNYYYGTAGSNTTPYQAFSMTNALDNNVWAHVVLVRDLTNMRLKWYKNGILTNETIASYSSATASTLPVEIGRGYAGNYAGLIDDIRVYNRALSDREIAILFNEGICAADICQAFENREVVLQVYGDSLKVNNTGRSTFVPAKSLTEWSEFKLHYPSHITISATTAAGCSLPWGGVINHGQSVTAYQSPGENCGPTCVSETRTCSNGVLSGSYQYRACISTCTCALPWGGTIDNEKSITAYENDNLPYGSSCVSETRTCNTGVLSGSYQYQSCIVREDIANNCGIASVIYGGITYGTVLRNGLCWLDRNLGAASIPATKDDSAGFGFIVQWGRSLDGHQTRGRTTTEVTSSTDTPGHSMFIINSVSPSDWRVPSNANLWQGVSGINNPCPIDWRIPTGSELNTERLSWSPADENGAFSSTLKWPNADIRWGSNGGVNTRNRIWTSTISGNYSYHVGSYTPTTYSTMSRANAFSVRCVYDL